MTIINHSSNRSCIVVVCDVCSVFQCENLNDAEQMTWMIVDHVNDLIQLAREPPVQDLLG
jgi:huntingtin